MEFYRSICDSIIKGIVAQLEFRFQTGGPIVPAANEEMLELGARRLRVVFVRHLRARRYVLRLLGDGTARVTLPRRGNFREAREFLQRNLAWLRRRLEQSAKQPPAVVEWKAGTPIFFRGAETTLHVTEASSHGIITFADEAIRIKETDVNLRPIVEAHLRRLATHELPPRLLELASMHGFTVRRISIRNQRSRWGSCSVRGTISLNWRLIQTPPYVSDYILFHELAHLRHMNHSKRYWAEVGRLCPGWREAERWLKQHSGRIL